MTDGRDRLRELLDAVLDENNPTLDRMAQHAYASPWHFSRRFTLGTGESPVALRRRVVLERAAWQLRHGATVTDAAFTAGYDSVEGFTRAFARAYGYTPSAAIRVLGTGNSDHWLASPNGVHFHPPTNLWVEDDDRRVESVTSAAQVVAQMVQHDLADTELLLNRASELGHDDYVRARFPGLVVLEWDGPEESVAGVLANLVWSKQVWLAAMCGEDQPRRGDTDLASVRSCFAETAPRWAEAVRDIHRRGAWGDLLIDALCDPPESFVLGGVITHVLTFAAHRRQLVRHMLRTAGLTIDDGDPLAWGRNER